MSLFYKRKINIADTGERVRIIDTCMAEDESHYIEGEIIDIIKNVPVYGSNEKCMFYEILLDNGETAQQIANDVFYDENLKMLVVRK